MVLLVVSTGAISAQANKTNIEKTVADFIAEVMNAFEIPGVAIGVVKDGAVYYTRGFGVKNIDNKEAVDKETVFHMASISKPLVATAIMQLVEADKVNLDEKVIRYALFRDRRCTER